jgi:nucleolar protein 6
MTDKQTKKPKGFAFVEFDRFDRMETCLKKYQHSLFGEGKKARKINVELT